MAREAIATRVAPLPAESLALSACIGRILRQDVYPERDNPPFDRVCMDGIAVRSDAVARGLRRFTIEATQAAGALPLTLAQPEGAIEVMTGAVLPNGTDCIIPVEEYELGAGVVSLKESATGAAYRNVQRQGSDGDLNVAMLTAGTRLGAPEMAVVASAGLGRINVARQPRIVVISTGDELIDPGQPIASHQVRRSNAYAVAAALREHGFDRITDDHIRDNPDALRERLGRHLTQQDVLVLSGGVSKGKFDLVPVALKALRVEEVFHQVAQRPGMPLWFGIGPQSQAVFGLPGNPVATLMCLVRYVVPGLLHAMGARAPQPETVALLTGVKKGRAVTSYVPVVLQTKGDGHAWAQPRIPNGSGDFLALAGTDGFVELPPSETGYPDGFVADFHRWRP